MQRDKSEDGDVSGVRLLDLVGGVGPDGTTFNDATDRADAVLHRST